eukprot:365532-Chlamydomonas_euryale.AAC.12
MADAGGVTTDSACGSGPATAAPVAAHADSVHAARPVAAHAAQHANADIGTRPAGDAPRHHPDRHAPMRSAGIGSGAVAALAAPATTAAAAAPPPAPGQSVVLPPPRQDGQRGALLAAAAACFLAAAAAAAARSRQRRGAERGASTDGVPPRRADGISAGCGGGDGRRSSPKKRAPDSEARRVRRTQRGQALGARGADELSLVSYNCLADSLASSLVRHVHPDFLGWERRKAGLLKELAELDADVVCLQEVDQDRCAARRADCLPVCIACLHVYTQGCMHGGMQAHMLAHTQACPHGCVCACAYACTHACAHACTHACIHACPYASMHAYLTAHVRTRTICVHVRMHAQCSVSRHGSVVRDGTMSRFVVQVGGAAALTTAERHVRWSAAEPGQQCRRQGRACVHRVVVAARAAEAGLGRAPQPRAARGATF